MSPVRTVLRAINGMQAHCRCPGDITIGDDSKHLRLGWACTCGEKWMMRISDAKLLPPGQFREIIRTREARENLIWKHGNVAIVRSEERA